jgi:hypothetical protein
MKATNATASTKYRLSSDMDGSRYAARLERNSPDIIAARELARECFEHYPKDRYETVVETWREVQSYNIEFVMKRLREPPCTIEKTRRVEVGGFKVQIAV